MSVFIISEIMEPFECRVIFPLLAAFLCVAVCRGQDTIQMHCDPHVNHRFDACPAGYCCVRDEFLPSYVYCKRIGKVQDPCTTHISESECPCHEGLRCRGNVESPTFTSLYGKCANASHTSGHV